MYKVTVRDRVTRKPVAKAQVYATQEQANQAACDLAVTYSGRGVVVCVEQVKE